MAKSTDKDTSSKDALTPDELELAKKIHEHVMGFLKTQYLWVALIIMVLAPVLGLLAGALLESKLFSASREKLLADARAGIEREVASSKAAATEAEKRIRDTSDKAREYLDAIRTTREALDFVMRGTQTGELALLQKRSTEVEKEITGFRKRLTDWERALKKDIPQGIEKLSA